MSSEPHNYFLNYNMHLEMEFLSFQLLKADIQWQFHSIIMYPKILISWEYTYICQALGSGLEQGSSDSLQHSDLNYTHLSPLDHPKQLSLGETCSNRDSKHDSVLGLAPSYSGELLTLQYQHVHAVNLTTQSLRELSIPANPCGSPQCSLSLVPLLPGLTWEVLGFN